MSMFSIATSGATSCAGDGLLEGVEVDADEVDRLDPLARQRRHVLGVVAPRQQRRVQPRVQRLHAAVEDLLLAGELGDVGHLEPGLAQRAGGAAGGEDLDPERGQALGEVGDAGLVGDRDQRPAHADRAVVGALVAGVGGGLSHRSTTVRGSLGVDPNPALRDHADRLRVELVLDRVDGRLQLLRGRRPTGTGTSRWRIGGPVSTPSSTKWTVTPVVSHARLQRLPDRVEPGEGRQQGGVDVDDAVAEAGDEGGAEQLHVAGEDDEVGAARLDPVGHRPRRAPPGPRTRRGRRPRSSRPRPAARSSAHASGLSEPTPTTSIPSRPCSVSRIACRLVPLPEARTTMRKCAHGAASSRRISAGSPVLELRRRGQPQDRARCRCLSVSVLGRPPSSRRGWAAGSAATSSPPPSPRPAGWGRSRSTAPARSSASCGAARRLTDRPLAVNLLLPFARRDWFEAAAAADVVVTFWGRPRRRTPGIWIHQCGSVAEARAAHAAGADAVIVQGVEAGGHVRGTTAGSGAARAGASGAARRATRCCSPAGSPSAPTSPAPSRPAPSAPSPAPASCSPRRAAPIPATRQRLLDADATILTELFGAGWPAPHRVVRNAATEHWLGAGPARAAPEPRPQPTAPAPGGPLHARRRCSCASSAPSAPAAACSPRPARPTTARPPWSTPGPLYAGETVARIDDVRAGGGARRGADALSSKRRRYAAAWSGDQPAAMSSRANLPFASSGSPSG